MRCLSTFSSPLFPTPVGVARRGRAGWAIHPKAINAVPSFRIVGVSGSEADRCEEEARNSPVSVTNTSVYGDGIIVPHPSYQIRFYPAQ